MNGRERRYNIEHQLNDLTNVLRRPVETATQSRHSKQQQVHECHAIYVRANYEAVDDYFHLARSVSYMRGLCGMAHVE